MTLSPVRLARQYSGLSQAALAKKMGRGQAFIARLESGTSDWVPVASAIADATGVPISFFHPDVRFAGPDTSISYRRRSTCPATVKARCEAYAVIAHTLAEPMVDALVKYPRCDIPSIPSPMIGSMEAARQFGGEVARKLREEWGIGWGPISDLIKLVESKGVRLFYVNSPETHLDGFAFWSADVPYIFVNRVFDDTARIRLDVAHELGHLIMHRDLELDARSDLLEAMAFGFAIEFLAPWSTIQCECPAVPRVEALVPMRRRWRVSMQAIVRHMKDNGAISATSYSSAFKRFSSLGFRRGSEPGWLMPEESVMHSAFLHQLSVKGVNVAELAESCGIPESMLGEIIPLSCKLDNDLIGIGT